MISTSTRVALSILAIALTVPVAAGAAKRPSMAELRQAMGLKKGEKVDLAKIKAARDKMKQRLGHVRRLKGKKIDLTHFSRASKGWKRAASRKAKRPTKPRPKPTAATLLARMGKATKGRLTLKGFRGRKGLFKMLDIKGRGYVTLDDIKQAMQGPRLRWKAAQFLKKFDKNKDWQVTPDELTNKAFFARLDSDKNGKIDLKEVLGYLTGQRAVKRRRRRGRAAK